MKTPKILFAVIFMTVTYSAISQVQVAVYDEIGKFVPILQDGVKQANTYEAEFDATNLPSGVYYYRLEAEGFVDTKKMVVIK